MTPCLLDADVFIRSKNDHYRFAVFPGFWDWLIKANADGAIFSIDRIRDELLGLSDELSDWVKTLPLSFFLATDTPVVQSARQLSVWANAQNYQPQALSRFFASGDYWLIAHAMTRGWRVVTHEVPAPDSKKNIKIPDACSAVGVACINPYQMLEDLGAKFVL